LGQRIHVLDPFGIAGKSIAAWKASYNPMDVLLRISGHRGRHFRLIADGISA
jgi:hypothetical protein